MPLVPFYGVTPSRGGRLVTHLLGAAHIGVDLLNWVARNTPESEVLGVIVLPYFIATAIGFIVAFSGELSGVMNVLGWFAVAICLLLAVGYGYSQFAQAYSS